MPGFIVTFPSSFNIPAYLVHPARFGAEPDPSAPWHRAAHVASAFETEADGWAAVESMVRANAHIAPEINHSLERRLGQAKVLPVEALPAGIELYQGP